MWCVRTAMALAAVTLFASCEPSTSKPEPSLLEQLAFQEDQLPAGCHIKQIPDGFFPGPKVVVPYVTEDPNLIPNLCQDDIRKIMDFSVVKAMLFAIYEEQNEVGVLGWRLASEEAAKALHEKLTDQIKPEPEKMVLWHHADHVVMLWRDSGTSDGCFNAFKDKIQGLLAADGAVLGS